MKRLIELTIILLLILSSLGSLAQNTTTENKEYIIIYDEGHKQFFTSELMFTALNSLNTSFDTSSTDVSVKLVLNKSEFNSTNLQGADLVIISNPGQKDGKPVEIGELEKRALSNIIDINTGILFMSNPLARNASIRGHGEPLNDLIFNRFDAQVSVDSAGSGDQDNTTLIVDEFNNDRNSSVVYIYARNINSETLVTEVNNITAVNEPRIKYYGSQISEDNNLPGEISGNTSSLAYVIDKSYNIKQFQNVPRWLYGQTFGENRGRAMLIGSTIMFSDYAYDNKSNWIDQEQNLAFFQNIVGWLLKITPLPEENPIVEEPFSFFIRTNIIAAILLGVGLFVGVFGRFIYRGRLQIKQIFDIFTIRTEKKTTTKKKTAIKKATKKKATKKGNKRVKRN